jgi:hypothetical protein
LLRILIEGTGGLSVRARHQFELFRVRNPFDFVAVKPGHSQGLDLGKREILPQRGGVRARYDWRKEKKKGKPAR